MSRKYFFDKWRRMGSGSNERLFRASLNLGQRIASASKRSGADATGKFAQHPDELH
jgi:hypothetical protein